MRAGAGGAAEWRAHWPTVLAATLGMSCTTLYVYSAGALVEPIEREMGWSRAQIGSGISVATAVAALLGPLMGAAVDRFGPRQLAVPGVLVFCAAVAALSLATRSLWSWWLLWLAVGLGGFGVKPSVWTAAVAGLFARSRGLALAVTLSGASIGSITIPLITTRLTADFGWRGAYVGLALIWATVVFPLLLMCFRDGRGARPAYRTTAGPRTSLPGLGIRAAIASWPFLALALSIFVFTFLSMAFSISLMPILTWQGIGRTEAAGLAAVIGAAAIVGRLSTGVLLDRFDPRLVTTLAMALPVVTAGLLIAEPGSVPIAALAILVMGLSLGAEIDAVAFMTGHYFGLRHYGLLFGSLISGSAVATGAAPLIAGTIYDRTGGYQALLIAIIPMSIVAALLIASIGPRRWQPEAADIA